VRALYIYIRNRKFLPHGASFKETKQKALKKDDISKHQSLL